MGGPGHQVLSERVNEWGDQGTRFSSERVNECVCVWGGGRGRPPSGRVNEWRGPGSPVRVNKWGDQVLQ